jgi:hypothetical protein
VDDTDGLPTRQVNWKQVAAENSVSNDHAARMRFHRLRLAFEGITPSKRTARGKGKGKGDKRTFGDVSDEEDYHIGKGKKGKRGFVYDSDYDDDDLVKHRLRSSQIKKELKKEVKEEVKIEAKVEVKDEIKDEVKDEVEAEVKFDIKNELGVKMEEDTHTPPPTESSTFIKPEPPSADTQSEVENLTEVPFIKTEERNASVLDISAAVSTMDSNKDTPEEPPSAAKVEVLAI